jgi:hypothetical protein
MSFAIKIGGKMVRVGSYLDEVNKKSILGISYYTNSVLIDNLIII